ncbi:MAG: NUDIX domain-containing protein [Sphingomicrobium sp.]
MMDQDAIPAATLIVVRDCRDGPPELLMVERADGMAFAAGALVFPGGRIDDSDHAMAAATGTDPAQVAAIRETLEETAFPAGLKPVPDAPLARQLQDALVADQPFADLLAAQRIALDPAAIIPFARWVPKFHAVRRFDTMFFIARAGDGEWPLRVIEGECAGARWIGAQQALDAERAGNARLIFPTRRNLERLAQHCDFDAIRADAAAHPIEPVTPWIVERDGKKYLTIPDHLGYPVSEEALDGQWRG